MEFLLTNGIGGFAMGCDDRVNRRKYHALLNAARKPPVDRVTTVNAVDVQLRRGDTTINLDLPGTFTRAPGRVVWDTRIDKADLRIELTVSHGVNGAAIRFTCSTEVDAGEDVELRLLPRISLRDFHEVAPERPATTYGVTLEGRNCIISHETGILRLRMSRGMWEACDEWKQDCIYPRETERHYPDTEDLYTPCVGRVPVSRQPTDVTIAIAFDDEPDLTLLDVNLRADHLEKIGRMFLREHAGREDLLPLVHAADDFLVTRVVDGTPLTSVIAGYPWFADWGRDTMIALPGLLLVTGRFEEALGALAAFGRHVSQGMIPNRFDDYDGPPHYNTVDASLWFIHACFAYRDASKDEARFRRDLLPACREIVAHYMTGTRFGIGMDEADHLIAAGDETTQLTWMDAKRDGVVFTPRHGKAVEINALWYHALRLLAGDDHDETMNTLADRVRDSFQAAFVRPGQDHLVDCLRPGDTGGWIAMNEIRPNQLFAVSLAHSPLTRAQQQAVVGSARTHLLTDRGMRTLAPSDPAYQARFKGDMMQRDNAYHNGTVWPWLIGPYAEAVLRADDFSDAARQEARAVIAPLIATLDRGCIGQIAEIFDAEPTDGERLEEGCVAQAWSVAEVLRIAVLAGR
ncbi:MAG: glycogen debranching enzyme N-terminal domain-containing protein [Phycisphaerales bacterium]|nr:glycogen debranching enzyme N-terminal domain-containing protein [Phycisphaerales bacterium]